MIKLMLIVVLWKRSCKEPITSQASLYKPFQLDKIVSSLAIKSILLHKDEKGRVDRFHYTTQSLRNAEWIYTVLEK